MSRVTTRIYVERGKSSAFACAVDWPGWCRRGKTEDDAVQALLDYVPRYRKVVGRDFEPGELTVVGRIQGTATTDFGAPDARGEWDEKQLTKAEAESQVKVLDKIWRYFDRVVAGAPAELRKGPRGGGRDRDAIVDHVREAERSYGRKVGVRVPPRTPWPEQRKELRAGLLGNDDVAW